jgi:hypothetical protein
MAQVDRRQEKLAKGKENRKAAERRLRELLSVRELNPEPESGRLTVAAVIDPYIEFAKTHIASRFLDERRYYLQSFAEEHGFRAAGKCARPVVSGRSPGPPPPTASASWCTSSA